MGKNRRFETKMIHDGYDSHEHFDSLTPPLYQSSTFTFQNAKVGEQRFAGEAEGFVYSRLGNPTTSILQERIAVLEGGQAGLAFSSGMAAVSAVLFALVKTGEHILCSEGVYGCTFGLLELMKDRFSIDHELIAMDSAEQLVLAIKPETKVIYVESPINPTMRLVDLEMVVNVAKVHDITVVVDNTFCSPYLQKPLEIGCDVVVHSATKYIGGHGDVIAGLIVGDKALINRISMTTQKDIGGIISPFDAWLLLRGLKTLAIRMDRHCENAQKIADKLKEHPKVKQVIYPGIKDFPQKRIADKQMAKPGGMISFEVIGDKNDAQQVMNHLELVKLAVSLGDAESLIQHPATMTHSVVPKKAREKMGITDELLRLSVGLEAWEDIWEDLESALNSL